MFLHRSADRSAARHESDSLIEDGFFRAMAYKRLGRRDDAREELQRLTETLRMHPDMNWRRQVEAEALRQEAEKLVFEAD